MKLIDFMANSDTASILSLPCLAQDEPDLPTESKAAAPRCLLHPTLQQIYQVQERLQSDLLACDLRFSLFVAAASNYRYETLLRPFPKEFLDSNLRPDIDAIFEVIAEVDRLEVLLDQLIKCNYNCHQGDVMNLLHAVLVRHGERVALTTLPMRDFMDLYKHLKIPPPTEAPTHIFEVTPSLKCSHTKLYTSLRERFPVRIGFYGGKLEQLYSMLTVGSLPTDEPLQLTSSVNEALKCSPKTPGWGASRCGAMLSFVAVVEYVVDPAHVSENLKTSRMIITDANCLQISYLMCFGQAYEKYEQTVMRRPSLSVCWRETLNWMEDNKYTLSLGLYLTMLSLSTSSGRGMLHKFVCTGIHVLRRGLFKI